MALFESIFSSAFRSVCCTQENADKYALHEDALFLDQEPVQKESPDIVPLKPTLSMQQSHVSFVPVTGPYVFSCPSYRPKPVLLRRSSTNFFFNQKSEDSANVYRRPSITFGIDNSDNQKGVTYSRRRMSSSILQTANTDILIAPIEPIGQIEVDVFDISPEWVKKVRYGQYLIKAELGSCDTSFAIDTLAEPFTVRMPMVLKLDVIVIEIYGIDESQEEHILAEIVNEVEFYDYEDVPVEADVNITGSPGENCKCQMRINFVDIVMVDSSTE